MCPTCLFVQVMTSAGMGVRMVCPGCLSNTHVKPPGASGHGFPSVNAGRVSGTFIFFVQSLATDLV